MRSSGFSSVRVLIRRAANYCRPLHCLQNALDAYVKGGEDEILSKPYGDPLMPQGAGAAAGSGVPVGATAPLDPIRARRRKPPRGNSSFLLRAVDSAGGFSGLSNLGFSLGFKVGGGFTTQGCFINKCYFSVCSFLLRFFSFTQASLPSPVLLFYFRRPLMKTPRRIAARPALVAPRPLRAEARSVWSVQIRARRRRTMKKGRRARTATTTTTL